MTGLMEMWLPREKLWSGLARTVTRSHTTIELGNGAQAGGAVAGFMLVDITQSSNSKTMLCKLDATLYYSACATGRVCIESFW